MHCSKTVLSLDNGRLALTTDDIAGVECSYNDDNDKQQACIMKPSWTNTPGSQCSPNGTIRLQGSQEAGTGRLEYCYNGYWSPFCELDPVAASIVCKQLGFTEYTGESIYAITALSFLSLKLYQSISLISLAYHKTLVSLITSHVPEQSLQFLNAQFTHQHVLISVLMPII